jgi:hypothetical protein
MSELPPRPALYSLYGVLVHSGHSVHSGHYYSYVRAPNGMWYICDDTHVAQVGLAAAGRAGCGWRRSVDRLAALLGACGRVIAGGGWWLGPAAARSPLLSFPAAAAAAAATPIALKFSSATYRLHLVLALLSPAGG